MATELHVWERDGRVERLHVPGEGLTIGRLPGPFGASYCTQNANVSRLHCRITRLGDGWFVEDLGSANGTKVNDELVDGPTPVFAGDVIAIGGLEAGLTARLVEGVASLDKIGTSYDVVAKKYAAELTDDMMARPLERALLQAFAELSRGAGGGDDAVGDVGCGPGHVSLFLSQHGLRTVGIDVSAAMIDEARVRFPDGEFHVASMFDLPVAHESWIGAVAMYSTLHCDAGERARLYGELARVVRSGGFLLHGFYVSAPDQPPGSTYHLQEWFGLTVDLPTHFVSIEDAAAELDRGGFDVSAALVREPMHAHELPTRRCYMLGKRR